MVTTRAGRVVPGAQVEPRHVELRQEGMDLGLAEAALGFLFGLALGFFFHTMAVVLGLAAGGVESGRVALSAAERSGQSGVDAVALPPQSIVFDAVSHLMRACDCILPP